jgi:hypothetical protein
MFKLASVRDRSRMSDADVAVIAKDLLDRYSRSHLLLRAFGDSCTGRKQMARVSRELLIGRSSRKSSVSAFGNGHMKELVMLVSFGVERGANMEKALSIFVRNLERGIFFQNRIRAKTGGSQALTLMGMGVFFPLFTGISAVIISSSLGMLDINASYTYTRFVAVSAAYVPMILYISSAFAHPDRGMLRNLTGIAPYFALAMAIIYSMQTFIGGIL